MALGGTLIIFGVLALMVWIAHEFKGIKHKFTAILLIALIIFSYFSIVSAFKGKDIDLKSSQGIKAAGKMYFLWLGSAFLNIKIITANAIKMDWTGETNSSINDSSSG